MKKQRKLIEDEKDDLNIDQELEQEKEEESSEEEMESDPNLDYRSLQSVVTYEDEDYIYSCNLNDKIDEIFQESRWTIINPSKKIPKDLIPFIFHMDRFISLLIIYCCIITNSYKFFNHAVFSAF